MFRLITSIEGRLLTQLQQQQWQAGGAKARTFASSSSSPAAAEDKIHLKGLVFYGYHGALEEEKVLGQNFVVDATLTTDLRKAGQTDNLNDTINYADVYMSIKQIVEGPPSNLLEHVAERIASSVLGHHQGVISVCIGIRKPHVAVGGVLDSLGIEITRSR